MTCEQCKRACDPLPCMSNPEASEHYCPRCHKSYPMADAEVRAVVSMARERRPEKAER